MNQKLEIIDYPNIKNMNLFVVEVDYCEPHLHPEVEMLFVFKGSPIFIINDEQFQFHPGDVILLNSNDKHEIISQEEASIFLCLQILPKYFEGYFPQISHVVFTDHCRYDIKHNLLIYTFLKLGEVYIEKPQYYQINCASMINIMYFYLLNQYSKYELNTDYNGAICHNKLRLSRITRYIEEHYNEKISLQDIADREGLSVYFLSHFIREHLKQNFQYYLTFVRFNHARDMILTTNMKLIDICYHCGFSDYRYMNQAFKRYCNSTPKEFKNRSSTTMVKKPSSGGNNQIIYSEEDALYIIRRAFQDFNLFEPNI